MGFSAKDRVRSFGYAGKGLRLLVSGQHNAWIHATLTVVAIGLGLALRISSLEWFGRRAKYMTMGIAGLWGSDKAGFFGVGRRPLTVIHSGSLLTPAAEPRLNW